MKSVGLRGAPRRVTPDNVALFHRVAWALRRILERIGGVRRNDNESVGYGIWRVTSLRGTAADEHVGYGGWPVMTDVPVGVVHNGGGWCWRVALSLSSLRRACSCRGDLCRHVVGQTYRRRNSSRETTDCWRARYPLEISRPIDRLWSGPYITGRLGSVVMVSASFQLFSRGVISGGIFPGGIISCDRDCLFHSGWEDDHVLIRRFTGHGATSSASSGCA